MTDAPKPSLLLVDDDPVLRPRLARALAKRGFQVREAADGAEALAAARAESPELAIIDLRLPDVTGLEVLRDLLAIDPTTRALMLTGYGSIGTAVEAMRLGAVNYLPKPADADEVVAAFERADEPPLTSGAPIEAPSLARAEWEHINRVLADCGGNVSEAARRLGLHRRSLQRKLQKRPPVD
ncbi:MAG: response regulator [Myxococcales bacterium]|nr:response regulator [Myxococcales bacterium]